MVERLGCAWLFGAWLFVLPPVWAGASTNEPTRMVADLLEAWNGRDVSGMVKLFSDRFVYVRVDQEPIEDEAALQAYIDRHFTIDYAPFQRIRAVYDPVGWEVREQGGVAVVQGGLREQQRLHSGKSFDLPVQFTATLTRESGGWRIAAFHSGVNAYENPVGQSSSRLWMQFMILAGVTGFVIGAILAMALVARGAARRRSQR